MADLEKVIKGLETCLRENIGGYKCETCPYLKDTGCVRKNKRDALELLKEQDSEKKRILKIVWDTLHEGLSIDTVSDQDWVYERIRNRIEGTYPET